MWYDGFWSSIVRFGHLFETAAFRQALRLCIVEEIVANFKLHIVEQLPEYFFEWTMKRAKVTRVHQPGIFTQTGRIEKQYQVHNALQIIDNGDIDSQFYDHWHVPGRGCCREDARDTIDFSALCQICRGYFNRFGGGFNVPLTYRWMGCDKAAIVCYIIFQLFVCITC